MPRLANSMQWLICIIMPSVHSTPVYIVMTVHIILDSLSSWTQNNDIVRSNQWCYLPSVWVTLHSQNTTTKLTDLWHLNSTVFINLGSLCFADCTLFVFMCQIHTEIVALLQKAFLQVSFSFCFTFSFSFESTCFCICFPH